MLSRTVLWWLLVPVLASVSALIGGYAWLQTGAGKRWLADQIETAASTPDHRLSIGALDGTIPFAPVVTGVNLSDSEGPWLTVDRAAIRLNPMALFDREARFDRIEVGQVSMSRLPIAPSSAAEDQRLSSFTLPELPIQVNLKHLGVAEVVLGASILGDSARFHVDGSARLGDPTNGLSLDLAVVGTDDSAGSLSVQVRYVPETQRLTTELRLDEPEGGMLARLAGLTGLPALTVDLAGDGRLDDWRAELMLDGGDDLTLDAEMAILAEGTSRRVTLESTGRFAALADDALFRLVDTETSVSGSALVGADDRLRIDRFDLAGGFGEASLTGEIDLTRETADIALTMVPGEPDRFARLTDAASWSGLRLSATIKGPFLEPTLTLSIDGASVAYGDIALESLVATVEAAATGPVTDSESRFDVVANLIIEGMDPGEIVPPGLLKPQIKIALDASFGTDAPVGIESLELSGAGLLMWVSGEIDADAIDIDWRLSLADLPARVRAELKVEQDGVIRIDGLALELASLTAEGAVTLNADRTVSGQVSAGVDSLADLAPLLGDTLSGTVDAAVSLSQDDRGQAVDARISATGAGLSGAAQVGKASLELQLSDLLTAPGVSAHLRAEGVLAGGSVLDRAEVAAVGSLEDLDVALDISGETLAANARGRIALVGGETEIEITALSARYADASAALAGPAHMTLARDSLVVDSLVLQAEGGRVSVNGRYGATSDLNLTLSGVPLDLARLVAPDLDLSGRLDGGARLTGTRNAPRASGDFAATGVTLPAVRAAGIAGLGLTGKIDWDAVALSLETKVSGGFGGSLTTSARLSAPADPATGLPMLDTDSSLTGRLSGDARLGVLNDLLAARGDRVKGNLTIDLSVGGRLADPRIAGTLSLTDGSYRGPLTGISLDDIRVRLNGEGDRLTVTELSAKAPNGGTVSARGGIGIDMDAGFPADISFKFVDALVIDNDVVSAEVAGDVVVTGKLMRSLKLAGRLTVVEAEIRLPERLPLLIQTLEVEEINVPSELLAQRPPPGPTAAGIGAPLRMALDLAIDASGRIFVRGRGLDTEVAGEVTVRGKADAPKIAGGFQLRRGHLDALGRRFNFDEGVVTLPEDGSVDADIRFVARAQASDVSAQITVSGRASAPQIRVESVPELPQDEILAQILFGKRSDSLSALESIQLARSAFQLTGIGTDPDVLGGVGSRLRLDQVDIQQKGAGSGGSALNLRRRVAEGIGLGVQQGLQAGSGRTTVELELLPNVSVETEVGVNSTGRVGIGMEWEY